MRDALTREIFALGSSVRYVAIGERQRLRLTQREGLDRASDEISDRFEELFVNPALVVLARQRGQLDCGGLRYLVVAYGHFTQLVVPSTAGHVSVSLEPATDPQIVADAVLQILARHGMQDEAAEPPRLDGRRGLGRR